MSHHTHHDPAVRRLIAAARAEGAREALAKVDAILTDVDEAFRIFDTPLDRMVAPTIHATVDAIRNAIRAEQYGGGDE